MLLIEYENEKLLNEDWKSKLAKAATIGSLATGLAYGNTGIKPVQGHDVKYGKDTVATLFHPRYGSSIDAGKYDYIFDKEPDTLSNQPAIDTTDYKLTAAKILATPTEILKKYGKLHADSIAKYAVDAAHKYNIDVNILLAILSTESGFDQNATSNTNVCSIAQITRSTLKSLQKHKRLKNKHDYEKIKTSTKHAIDAAADIIGYFSNHVHGNIEMIFAEYNGGHAGGASPYRMHRQGKTDADIAAWMKKNKYKKSTITHYFDETEPYVEKCMKAYHFYLQLDENPPKPDSSSSDSTKTKQK